MPVGKVEEFTPQPHKPCRAGPRAAAPAPKDAPNIPIGLSPERQSFRVTLGTGSALLVHLYRVYAVDGELSYGSIFKGIITKSIQNQRTFNAKLFES